MLGIKFLLKEECRHLSGGQKQKIAIARALLLDPDIILADEPSIALDQQSVESMVHFFNEMIFQSKTIIITSHDLESRFKKQRIIEL
jgi:putative ABC transport system ATP-binding protein